MPSDNSDLNPIFYSVYQFRRDTCPQAPAEDDEIVKLERQFKQLKNKMAQDGFITVGYFCAIMNLDCDNPYHIYCGDVDKWQKKIIQELSRKADDPKTVKQLIEALHSQYDDEEEEE